MSAQFTEKIELLPVSLLDMNRPLVDELRAVARSLNLEFGWHYLLDLTWIISQLGVVSGRRIMDAGAGTGVMQWYLAQEGAEIISVDRGSRASLPLRYRARYDVHGLRTGDLRPMSQVLMKDLLQGARWLVKTSASSLSGETRLPRPAGRVLIYNQDLKHLNDIPDNSLDAVVAVSALEHNQPEDLEQVVAELMRVLKPGGPLLATLCAARTEDWWHEPSSGWCYTDGSLRRRFHLPEGTPSNYEQYDRLLVDLRNCAELRDGLARFYYRSIKNGMPGGVWNPQYLPVGICKVKPV